LPKLIALKQSDRDAAGRLSLAGERSSDKLGVAEGALNGAPAQAALPKLREVAAQIDKVSNQRGQLSIFG
jgi:hypothetical protein